MMNVVTVFLQRCRRFRSDCDGSMAIEFAFMFPIALLLMLSVFQISMVFIATQNLENATAELGRYVRTGQAQSEDVSQAAFREHICDKLVFFLGCTNGNFHVDVRTLPNFGATALEWPLDEYGNFDGPGTYELGIGGEIVIVRTFYKFPVWLPMIGPKLANIGTDKLLLASASAFRNEPF